MTRQILTADAIFDGKQLHRNAALVVTSGKVEAILPSLHPHQGEAHFAGVLAPGLLDLQVNGGGGHMVGPQTTPDQLLQICAAHERLGASAILPTLITDTPQTTARVIEAGMQIAAHPAFLGLHLEGPHLDPRRKGAHDLALVRPMTQEDCARLEEAAAHLPALMVTLAPCAASADQIARLRAAGVIVSLGHSEATCAEAEEAFKAGATVATHLYNAMSQLGNREPGMVGAILAGSAYAGVIADGYHIAKHSLQIALAARPQGLFLVTDAMAVAGTEAPDFLLNGRRVLRQGGRLILEDGTLAGADLSLPQAIRYLVKTLGQPLERALAMATSIPAEALGCETSRGHLAQGRNADFVWLDDDLNLKGQWRKGERLF